MTLPGRLAEPDSLDIMVARCGQPILISAQ